MQTEKFSSEGMPTDAPHENASSPEPSFAAVPTEEMKEEGPLWGNSFKGSACSVHSGGRHIGGGFAVADAPMAGTLEAERAQAAPSQCASNTLLSPDGLFRAARIWTAAPSGKDWRDGRWRHGPRPPSDSAGAQEAWAGYPSDRSPSYSRENGIL